MTNTKPTLEEIGAYVDGELLPEKAASVARAIAFDPDIAHQVVCLTQLKATLPLIVPEANIELPVAPPAPRRRQAIAASIVAFVVAAGITAMSFWGEKETSSDWVSFAQTQHEQWVSKAIAPTDNTLDPFTLVVQASRSYGSEVFVPDLSAARLSLIGVNVLERKNTKSVHLKYKGTRGCQLSLFILPQPLAREHRVIESGSIRIAQWHHGDMGYLLMVSGMDPRHFDVLANMLGKLEGLKQPFQNPARQILAQSRDRAKPCLA